ncbi:flagellar basal-body MS-ring/collar protein FliF [Roseicyclus sp. F158]|uniref:Flagellar M-ring protein n=1 Tax=Tropicimonas omnivorans TaxID=3075590 RepID=A0ABU3DDR1_9RHOB|nr:flagellar basal-body MS-ring/collar protein FliF [Roseicyclus sp. F158]MDT0681674.1 flagellar basal-body MS-ring/collar protein FliF [Roseicyclus sp. F158]
MNNLLSVWSALDTRKKIIAGAAAAAMFAAVLMLSNLATKPGMALLYAGLEGAAAGDVISALDQRSVPYEVRGNAIWVPSTERDSLRMSLAGEGLPASGGAGYELLDGLSGFGTTAQMFDAAYWRAKEGELARTMVASPQIRAARVHIATGDSRPFERDADASASVSVTPAGGSVSAETARALRSLVASAVPSLSPDDVTVIDAATGAVVDGTDAAGAQSGASRADEMERSIERLLEAYVGPGGAIVEISLDTETESEQIVERRIDPDERVAISTETESRNSSSSGSEGDVTVASNLPDGDASAAGERRSTDNESRERVNFEISETTREILRAPGTIRRQTVAVLVNGRVETAAGGEETIVPRSDEELSELRELVESAVGYDEARGDRITVKSLAFMPGADLGTAAPVGWSQRFAIDAMALMQLVVLSLVALALGLFVVRPILAGNRGVAALPSPPETAKEESSPETAREARPIAPELPSAADAPGDASFELSSPGSSAAPAPALPPADPVDRLRSLMSERREETMKVLQSWMDDKEDA